MFRLNSIVNLVYYQDSGSQSETVQGLSRFSNHFYKPSKKLQGFLEVAEVEVRHSLWTSTTCSRSLCSPNQSVFFKLPLCSSNPTPTSSAFFVWNSETCEGHNKK